MKPELRFEKGTKPTWKDVLDNEKWPNWIGNINDFIPCVQSTGYILFSWNDRIYEIVGNIAYDTHWTVKDLECK
jgi:hypothetical protein